MRGKWVLIGAAVVLAAIAAGALSRLRHASSLSAAPEQKTAAPASPAEIILTGRIDPQHTVVAGAQVGGTLDEVLAEVGQDVYVGELLARISNQGLQAAEDSAKTAVDIVQARVEKTASALIAARMEATRARADATRARTELDRAERAWQRQQMLNREGATPRLTFEKSQREFEQAQSQAQSLQDLARIAEDRIDELGKEQENAKRLLEEKSKDLEDAKASLQNAEVHAPADGLLVERKGEVGRQLDAQEQAEMFKIAVDVAELQVTVAMDTAALARMKPGNAALVAIAELGGDGLPAVVKEIQGNQATVAFTSPNAAVKPGMMAQVRIRLP